MKIDNVDIVCGLCWGDEAKGKIVSNLLMKDRYDWVCRWSGGSNAGHTIYINDIKYVTHIIPCGIFYNIKCYIGPDCYLNIEDFKKEIEYLKNNNFNTNLIKISPKTHIILSKHKEEDYKRNTNKHYSTCKGIAPCASDKFNRTGLRFIDYLNSEDYLNSYIMEDYLMKEELNGNIMCEGAQGFWLDINQGNYPYVTSSYTLPYSSCSLGFPPNKIRDIYGACKIYDTRVGEDLEFDKMVDKYNNDKKILVEIGDLGNEFGATTGKRRNVNWLNMDKLIESVNISGCNNIIISKTDILEKIDIFRLIYKDKINSFNSMDEMKNGISKILNKECVLLKNIVFSDNPINI